MENYNNTTVLDCEFMYEFKGKYAVCSNGKVIDFKEEVTEGSVHNG